jgi:hypothetical protein
MPPPPPSRRPRRDTVRRWWHLLLLATLVPLLAACTPAGGHVSRQTAIDSGPVLTPQQVADLPDGIETVRVAYDLLLDRYRAPLKSSDLLAAAWMGVQQEGAKDGISVPEAPRFSGHRDSDFAAFRARFSHTGTPEDAGLLAAAAVTAMARSLHDDHTGFIPAALMAELQQAQTPPATPASQPLFESRLVTYGIGEIRLRVFPAPGIPLPDGGTLAQDLDSALQGFEAVGVTGIVLDLRGNPGGAIASVGTLTGRFLSPAVVSVVESRQGGRDEVLSDGHEFPVQHPLAMLIDGKSASAAEVAAEEFQETNRARLFGTPTAGKVNGAGIASLPGGAGLEITEERVLAPETLRPLDGVSVLPDSLVLPATAPDQDPVLAAAEDWLQRATLPAVAAAVAPAPSLSAGQIRDQLAPYGARVDDLPATSGLRQLDAVVVDTPEELVSGQPDALQRAASVGSTGWAGSMVQAFGSDAETPYVVTLSLFASAADAARAFQVADTAFAGAPRAVQAVIAPVRFGDNTLFLKGVGPADGETLVTWQRGRLLFSVTYNSEPGYAAFAPAVQIARSLDARYLQQPLP